MPRFTGAVTLTTNPQRLQRPEDRPFAALGVANLGAETAIIDIGGAQWAVNAGFRQVVPLPTHRQPLYARTASNSTSVELSWYDPEDMAGVAGLSSSLPQAATGTLTTATTIGTVAVSSIETAVSLAYSATAPLPVAITTPSDTTPALDIYLGTVTTASTYQLVASTGGTLLACVMSNTGADSLSWGLTASDVAPSAPAFVQASGAPPITLPAQLGLLGPLYLWVTSATAGAPYGALFAAS